MNTMGIDIGTSGCKAIVCDAQGRQLAEAHRQYALLSPEAGAAELDSEAVMTACFEVIRMAAEAAGRGSVAALGVSSQGEAFTAVGADGKALCHAMVSSDVRATHHAETWPQTFGAKRLYEITGHTAHPMFPSSSCCGCATTGPRCGVMRRVSSASKICSACDWVWSRPWGGRWPGGPCYLMSAAMSGTRIFSPQSVWMARAWRGQCRPAK